MCLLPAYPHYFERQEWTTPGLASHAGYVWTVAYESAPDTTEYRKRISSLTNQQGIRRNLHLAYMYIHVIGSSIKKT